MALNSQNIVKVKDIVKKINDLNDKNIIFLEKLNSDLMMDNNYQVFVIGTNIGQEVNTNLYKMFDISQSLCKEELREFCQLYSNYIENQENLNNKTIE